jgi:hypothetical protein
MARNRTTLLLCILVAAAGGVGAYVSTRPHPIVGRWKLDLPTSSTGTGKTLVLLSDGTGDLDGSAFHYRIVDGKNLVVTYAPGGLYVWPFELDGDHLTLTAFRETQKYTRAP